MCVISCSGTMPVSCFVINCARRFEKGSGITFLRIPDREPKRSAWINAIRRKNWMPSEHERVCSVHFLSGMFQFCLMLSVEKCHKTNFAFGVLLFYYFRGILYFLCTFELVSLLSNLCLQGQTTDDPNDPDYVPSLLMGYMEEGCFERCQKKKERYLRCLRRSEIKEKTKKDRNPRRGRGTSRPFTKQWKHFITSPNRGIIHG